MIDDSIKRVGKAIACIERSLKKSLRIVDIADEVGYSVFHFCRVFSKTAHITPYNYLMRRRLSQSALDLSNTEKRIVDIAFDYQFNSHEAYSRAFKRMFGVQPIQWRTGSRTPVVKLMPVITIEHLRHWNGGGCQAAGLEELGAINTSGLMTMAEIGRSETDRLWRCLHDELEHTEVKDILMFYGVSCYPADENSPAWYYASFQGDPPEVDTSFFVHKTIQPATYAAFTHHGPYNKRGYTRDFIHHIWLPKTGYSTKHPLEIERYTPENRQKNTEPLDWDILIPICTP